MILVGMPDSPYVRRVAVSLKMMGVPFEHQQVSVFRHYDRFKAINPVVKAPSFICDDGTVLMDSTLILDHVETIVPPDRRLMPHGIDERREALRLIGLAMAACEKCVAMVYEKERRAVVDQPWMARLVEQANAAMALLEESLGTGLSLGGSARGDSHEFDAADVAVACAWRFSQYYDAAEVPAASYPHLVAFSQRAEARPEFASTPLD
jgi:glutathione S-transferase